MSPPRAGVALAALALVAGAPSRPQGAPPAYDQPVTGFVSAHGERALVMGYPDGLEVWAYPLQLADGYRVRFRVAGRVDAVDAGPLLRRVERRVDEVVRTYVGPDFVVRERLFVPRGAAGVILRYEVDGRPDVAVEASFRPVLDLMWPGALGGQTVGWDAARSGYVVREPLRGFAATIASREAAAHDGVENRTRGSDRLAMLLAPRGPAGGARTAVLAFALDPGPRADGAGALLAGEAAARTDARAHAGQVLAGSVRFETPDPAATRALASAELALDGAWACGDALGCGALAGYGPSRRGRRPQYAWFFAGDGLVAARAMADAGQVGRARDELSFVTRYQDPRTGVIWHEMSQSAPLIDWVRRYPYMYVHVDISFQYLAAVRDYVDATGDVGFARENRRALAGAWRYCRSVIDPATGLPRIPPGKQGQNEQEPLRDDIRLSSLWIDAADGYAALARATGRAGEARVAERAAARARAALAAGGWDEAGGFWLSGHTAAGAPVRSARPDAIGVLNQGVFPPDRVARVLDRIASPDFLTDWGVRSLAASDPAYDPNLYSAGSVWGLGSATVAEAFWARHRAATAWAIWRGLAAWDTLDSAGHLHEVLAGDLHHPEMESVPEQTWSSAGLLSAAVRGLYGLTVRAGTVRVAPHLPPDWPGAAVRGVRVGAARLDLALARDAEGATLTVDNGGPPTPVTFAPPLPPGAEPRGATVAGRPADVRVEPDTPDRHAAVRFTAAAGRTVVRVRHAGGAEVWPVARPPTPGARSRNPILVGTAVAGGVLTVDAWTAADGSGDLVLATAGVPGAATGADLASMGGGRWRVRLTADGPRMGGYVRRRATVRLAP